MQWVRVWTSFVDFRILSLLVFLVPCRILPLPEWRFFQRHPLPGIAWKQISFVLCSPSLVFLAGLGVMYCLYCRHGAEGGLLLVFFSMHNSRNLCLYCVFYYQCQWILYQDEDIRENLLPSTSEDHDLLATL